MKLKTSSFKILDEYLFNRVVVTLRQGVAFDVNSPLSDTYGGCHIELSRENILRQDRRVRDFERDEQTKFAPYLVYLYSEDSGCCVARYDPRDHSAQVFTYPLKEQYDNSSILLERLEYTFKTNPPFNKVTRKEEYEG